MIPEEEAMKEPQFLFEINPPIAMLMLMLMLMLAFQ